MSSCWVSIDQLETLVSEFYHYENESLILSWICSLQSSSGSNKRPLTDVFQLRLLVPSVEPQKSLEQLSNSLGDELHVRFIKPNVKYIELDKVVGTVVTEEIPEIYQAKYPRTNWTTRLAQSVPLG